MTAQRLGQLRSLLDHYHIDGYLIPKADEHQCEYIRPDAERLKWLTGFSGSAGLAIVLRDKAALCIDGRYVLQALAEVEPALFEIVDTTSVSPASWLVKNISSHANIGFDPWLMTGHAFKTYEKLLREKEASLIPLDQNLVDCLWHDKPPRSADEAVVHPPEVAGVSHHEKLEKLAQKIAGKGADVALITMVESVNWLFNIRGRDLTYMPVVFSFAFIHQDGRATLFIDPVKITSEVRTHLGKKIEIRSYEEILPALEDLGRQRHTVWIDPLLAPVRLMTAFQQAGGRVLEAEDPTLLPKACKNATEIKGMRETHLRDGAALTMFLHWVTKEAVRQEITEMDASQKLHEFRAQSPTFWRESFPTISATGSHGAVVHYRVTPSTNRILQTGNLYLVDSGGHYHDGSTDVTRTLILGNPTPEQKDRFTRVLKGHIALAQLVFPKGTTGGQMDAFARSFLWQAGLDYAHGTGHGVGSVLNVHEGPQRISKASSAIALHPGMILSNEPGYYKPNHYGIRLENLVVVIPIEVPGAEQPMLGFETLTLVPIDTVLVECSLMTCLEIKWLNDYHQHVRSALTPLIKGTGAKEWLQKATRPL